MSPQAPPGSDNVHNLIFNLVTLYGEGHFEKQKEVVPHILIDAVFLDLRYFNE